MLFWFSPILNSTTSLHLAHIGGPRVPRQQRSAPWSGSGWFWRAPWWTRTTGHCLWLESGSWTGGLGRRFLRPGGEREDGVTERTLKALIWATGDIITLHSLKLEPTDWVHSWRRNAVTLCPEAWASALLPWQPPGPFWSRRRIRFGLRAELSSQTDTPEPERASSESACWAWLDSCRSWVCGWTSPSGGSRFLWRRQKVSAAQKQTEGKKQQNRTFNN